MDTPHRFSDPYSTISSATLSHPGIHRSALSHVTQSHNLTLPGSSGHSQPGFGGNLLPALAPVPPSRQQMTFHLDCNAPPLLFPGLVLASPAETALACIAVFLLAVLFEGLKVGREVLLHGRAGTPGPDSGPLPGPNGSLQTEIQQAVGQQMFSLSHLLQTTLHVIQVLVSCLLMLVFMSYNGYLCMALAVGSGLGFFLISWKKPVVIDVPVRRR